MQPPPEDKLNEHFRCCFFHISRTSLWEGLLTNVVSAPTSYLPLQCIVAGGSHERYELRLCQWHQHQPASRPPTPVSERVLTIFASLAWALVCFCWQPLILRTSRGPTAGVRKEEDAQVTSALDGYPELFPVDMDLPSEKLAIQVCQTCKARKKRCDKVLPECGFCVSRNIRCRYDELLSPSVQSGVSLSPGKWLQYTPEDDRRTGNKWTSGSPGTGQSTPTVSGRSASKAFGAKESDDAIWNYLCDSIASYGLSLDAMVDRFFDGVHTWLPIISPPHFRQTIATSQSHKLSPDLAMLALTMWLLALRPAQDVTAQPLSSLQAIYVTTKSFFCQLQIGTSTSISLIQAAVLLAAYEYACERLETAYTSLGLASRMCYIAGFGLSEATAATQPIDPALLEARNIWWGILSLER
jgi:hypothetical protein